MATAVVAPSLLALDREITTVAPKRTLPTWYRGDKAHQNRASGHNPDDTPGSKAEYTDSDNKPEIRAGDYRLPLNAQFTAEQLVQYLVKECRAGRITWIAYIIFNRRIWHMRDGFQTRTYTGSNGHTEHFHVSCKSDTASENNTKPVGLKQWLANLLKPVAPKPPAKPSASLPTYKNGSRQNSASKNNVGTDVATLQRFIGSARAGAADGRFGPKTTAGVKWYQEEILGFKGKNVDGIAGPKTWAPILRELARTK